MTLHRVIPPGIRDYFVIFFSIRFLLFINEVLRAMSETRRYAGKFIRKGDVTLRRILQQTPRAS